MLSQPRYALINSNQKQTLQIYKALPVSYKDGLALLSGRD